MSQIVGKIEGFDVHYVPVKDILFCKNTALKRSILEDFLYGGVDRVSIPSKNIVLYKDNSVVSLGCLTLSYSDADDILNKTKNGKNYSSEH
jgi:hypothetical protein